MPYYAVANGRNNGVYDSWSECKNQVNGYSGASFKKFDTIAGAQNFIAGGGGGSMADSSQSHHYNFTPSSSNYDRSYSSSNATSSQAQWGGGGRGGYSHYSDDSEYMDTKTMSRGNFETDDSGFVQVYTDGACSSNGRSNAKAGLGVYWGDKHPLNKSAPVSGRATNNSGEIQAATTAIKQALENGVTKLTVNTDSQFLIDSATKWMPGWKQNGWKLASGEPVKNETDFKDLDRVQHKLEIKWNHVDAHQGNPGNEMADQLAKAGASMQKK